MGNAPIITNDIIEFEGPKEFQILGRYDNVINSGGVKIHPTFIEGKIGDLLNDPFFIHYLKDEKLGQKLILVIEKDCPYDHTTLGLLQNSLKDLLTPYEVPKEIIFVKEFRRTESGKIIRNVE